jgi:hypothetical protein
MDLLIFYFALKDITKFKIIDEVKKKELEPIENPQYRKTYKNVKILNPKFKIINEVKKKELDPIEDLQYRKTYKDVKIINPKF